MWYSRCGIVDGVGSVRVDMCVYLCKCVSQLCDRVQVVEWIELVV